MSSSYIFPLKELFVTSANRDNAIPMAKYMKNKFNFLGIKTPARKALIREFLTNNGLPNESNLISVMKELWELPHREYQYAALHILEMVVKRRNWGDLSLFEYLVVTKSWWDTVDWIATRIIGRYLQKNSNQILSAHHSWMLSENMWLHRVCILFQLKYKEKTDYDLLFNTIIQLGDSKEFFIQKAIGWALREYSKTDPEKVIRFIDQNSLSPLSRREGLKVVRKNFST